MPNKPAIFLLAMLISFSAREALAAPRGLFMVGDFTQWVDLRYQYDSVKTKTSETFSRSQNYFQEEYHAQTAYAILDPRLWRGKLGGGVSTNQTYASSSTGFASDASGRSFNYNLTGAVIERSPFPLHFFAQSELTHAQRDFSAPYDLTLDTAGFNFAIKSGLLPSKFSYTRSSSEIKGSDANRTNDSNSLVVEVSHQLGKVSDTNGHLTMSQSQAHTAGGSASAESRTYEVGLRNQLHFSTSVENRMLTSNVLKREEARISGNDRQDQKTWLVDEQLSWPLGKALDLGANYSFTNRETLLATDNYQSGRLWVQHRLFESLTTQLEGNFRKDDLSTGTESSTSGFLGLFYQKLLPLQSQVQLNFSEFYQETERDQTGISQQILDEPHTVTEGTIIVGIAAPIVLANGNVDQNDIQVRNASSAGGRDLIPYVQDRDYSVLQLGSQTQLIILPGSDINLGDNLLITYSRLANPKVGYATTTRNAGFNLPLFDYAYRFYGNWLDVGQELLSGEANLVRLTNQTAYKVGLEAVRSAFTTGGEYEAVDSDQDRHRTILGFLRSSRGLGNGILTVYVTDAYTKSEPNSFTVIGQSGTAVNSLNGGGTYNATLFGAVRMLLTAKYVNVRGDTVSRDDFSLGCNLQWNVGKISASALSQYNWKKQPGSTSQDQFIRLQLTRHF